MAQSPSVGTSAQILTHARFDRAPVVQHPRRGRLPNTVIKFWKISGDRRMARYMAQQRQEEIEKTQLRIHDHEWIAKEYRRQLAELKTKNH
jgi:hypothetical protein